MLSNLKARFERNLIYVSPGAGFALGSGLAGICLLGPWWEAYTSAGSQTCDLWFQFWGFYYISITYWSLEL